MQGHANTEEVLLTFKHTFFALFLLSCYITHKIRDAT